jgi:hypothetical protein
MKIGPACEYAGDVCPKVLYAAVEKQELRVARVGVGRNFLFGDVWIDEWLARCAEKKKPDYKKKRSALKKQVSASTNLPDHVTADPIERPDIDAFIESRKEHSA